MEKEVDLQRNTREFLDAIVSIPSVSRHEKEVVQKIAASFSALGCSVRLAPINENILNDPASAAMFEPGDLHDYSGRHNIEIVLPGRTDRKIAINAHLDTVPAAENMKIGLEGNRYYGRGACDDKGQIAGLYYAISKMITQDQLPESSVTVHLVVEEEIGGNGSLSLNILPGQYDGAVVLEPTSLNIATAARGVVWFQVTAHGVSGHSGDASNTRSALLLAVKAIGLIQEYHAEQKRKYEGKPPFEACTIPLCFGKLHSGTWPAMVPDKAVLEGIIGVFPGTTSDTVSREIQDVLNCPDLAGSVDVEFTLKRDPNVSDRDSWLVRSLESACREAGIAPRLDVLPACCDAFFYARQGIPVVVLGAGELKKCHAEDEFVELDQVYNLGEILYNLLWQKV